MTEPNPPQNGRWAALRQWGRKHLTRMRSASQAAWTKAKAAPWLTVGSWTGGAFGVLGLTLALFLTFADWNAMRRPIAGFVSAATGRTISIEGSLRVYPWSWTPRLHAQGLHISNQSRFQDRGGFAEIGDADIKIKLLPLLLGQFDIVSLDLSGANVALYRTADGDANWANAPSAARAGKPFKMPAIRHFSIRGGQLFLRDDQRKLTLNAAFSTEEVVAPADGGRFALNGDGRINDQRFRLTLSGAPLIHVRQDRPYAFTADLQAGATHIQANGAIARPFDFGAWYAVVQGVGPDLSDLYHLTGLALPNTPPYSLTGRLDRSGNVYRMQDIAGRVGRSDLHGAFSATHQNDGRLFLDGNFRTANLNMNDLLAVLGGGQSRNARTTTLAASTGRLSNGDSVGQTPISARIMPDAQLDISRVRNMDARVSYRAMHVNSEHLPLRGFTVDINLDHGLMKLDPMVLELLQGRVTGGVSINARDSTPLVNADLRLSQARVELIFPMNGNPPLTGSLLGRAHLIGRGASVHEAAAHANGDITFVTPHGEVRESLAELTGINVTRGLGLILAHNQDKIEVRCGVASFHVDNGIAHANTFVFDTHTMLIHGRGDVSLRDETLDLQIRGEPKQPRLVRVAAPITVRGAWSRPQVGVQAGRAAGQGFAALLASFAAPVAAILPFVDAGLAKDADCGTLLAEGAGPRRSNEG